MHPRADLQCRCTALGWEAAGALAAVEKAVQEEREGVMSLMLGSTSAVVVPKKERKKVLE